MATDHSNYDPLRNPQVDYDRSDLSAKGILWFLIGLFIAGVFIELVIWGMFRFMARSEALFPQPQRNPMAVAQQAKAADASRSVLQNTPGVNLAIFPMPRLQPNDAGDMEKFLASEQKLLDPEQPFADSTGAIHIPISQAMKLIEDRGLPVRPNSPPPDFAALSNPASSQATNAAPGLKTPGGAGNGSTRPATGVNDRTANPAVGEPK